MKKSVTFRFDSGLLERARRRATADNRSLTNYVETAILRAVERPDRSIKTSVVNETGQMREDSET